MSTTTATTGTLYVPIEYATGRVCDDCRMLHANAYTPDDMSDDERDEYLARVDAHTAGYTNVAIGAGYDECEHDADDDADVHSENCDSLGFMVNSSCDSCGSNLGGTRYAATFFLPRRVNLVKVPTTYRLLGRMASTESTERDVAFWTAYGENISPSSALAIAADWHSPGSTFSLLSHGLEFDIADAIETVEDQRAELLDDGVTLDSEDESPRGGWTGDDLEMLDALISFLRGLVA